MAFNIKPKWARSYSSCHKFSIQIFTSSCCDCISMIIQLSARGSPPLNKKPNYLSSTSMCLTRVLLKKYVDSILVPLLSRLLLLPLNIITKSAVLKQICRYEQVVVYFNLLPLFASSPNRYVNHCFDCCLIWGGQSDEKI